MTQTEQSATVIAVTAASTLPPTPTAPTPVNDSVSRMTSKGNIANIPPHSYCTSYSGLPERLTSDDSSPLYSDAVLRELLEASRTPLARCPVTNITITTPLHAEAWARRLAATHYPSPAAAVTLVKCLRLGVDLGFRGDRTCTQIGPNLSSANDHPTAIADDLAKETEIGRRRGPYSQPPFTFFYSNPLGVVFKKGKSKPRVIHHLSWPRSSSAGHSVNASTVEFEVKLDAFDKSVQAVRQLGNGCFLSKIDVDSAYRNIPVRPADWPLLGMQWDNKYYFDIVVQFGLASATAIFEWYSSAAQHIAQRSLAIQYLVHYVDDFMLIMHDHDAAKLKLQQLLALFAELGIPISMKKLEGPVTSIVFLGILFDTVAMTIRLDDERLAAIHSELAAWNERVSASREELQSLIGILSFAAKVVAPGRTFLRRMIDHLKTIPNHADSTAPFPLSSDFQKDLQWWRQFLTRWNGVSVVPDVDWSPAHTLAIYTDACVAGYGALFGPHWFACQWTEQEEELAARDKRDSMPFKELYALAKAAVTWGPQWKGRKILFHCDCQPNVDAWRRGDSSKPAISNLIRTLLFIAATHEFNMNIIHIPGVKNVYADMLSRGQVQRFLDSHAQHDPSPTIPLPLPTQTW